MWGCVQKHLNHGTEVKTNKDPACKLKARIERIPQNLTTLLDLCNNASRGIWTNNVSRRDGEPRPLAEAKHQTRPLAEAKHQATEQRKWLAPKLRETWVQNHHEHLNHLHGFASSWSLLNQRTKRCCVCRDFTAARCDHKATKCVWLGRVSKTARVTLKITKCEFQRKSLKDTCWDQLAKLTHCA